MIKGFAARRMIAWMFLLPALAFVPAISLGSPSAPPPALLQEGSQTRTVTVRVSAEDSKKLLIKQPSPEGYPVWAKHNGVEGTVNLEFTVTVQGRVTDITPTSGDPLLINMAKECVLRWEYKPYIVQGRPTAMRTTTWIKFELHPQKITVE